MAGDFVDNNDKYFGGGDSRINGGKKDRGDFL